MYNGLTIVMANPSRRDIYNRYLLSGYAGKFFEEECLNPQTNIASCEVRTMEDHSPLRTNTKALLLLGEAAFQEWTFREYKGYTLGEQRGCPLKTPYGVPCVASYLPQDAVDFKDYEKELNPLLKDKEEDTIPEGEDIEEKGHKGITQRQNWRFWLKRDTKKILSILKDGIIPPSPEVKYHIYPSLGELEVILHKKDGFIFLDIETHPITQDLLCIGFSLGLPDVYVVPVRRAHDWSLAYGDNWARVLQLFAYALAHNTLVCHNAMFDSLLLVWKHRLLITRNVYCTMMAHHRCFVAVEKSLGHAMSHLTWEPYHKDEGIFNPRNHLQERQLWEYNGKDVYGMMLVKAALDRYSLNIPGLPESIAQANSSIRPFIIQTLTGIKFEESARIKQIAENDRLMSHYSKAIEILVGSDIKKRYSGASKSCLAASNKQCVKYFHEIMGYKPVKRSRKTNKPSLDEGSLWKIKLKHETNAVIDLILAYRSKQKETGMLAFVPWLQ